MNTYLFKLNIKHHYAVLDTILITKTDHKHEINIAKNHFYVKHATILF